MFKRYIRFLDVLYIICISIGAVAICVMSLIITWGVFTRYVLATGSFWPEPISIFLMIQFTFYGAVACYRADHHIGVALLSTKLPEKFKIIQEYLIHLLMGGVSLFMVIYGIDLVETTLFQSYPEFEYIKVGVAYSPIPIGGAIMLLFAVEKLLLIFSRHKTQEA